MDEELSSQSLEGRIQKSLQLLSSITKRPITLFKRNPDIFDDKIKDSFPFSCEIHLGDEYKIRMWHNLTKDSEWKGSADFSANDCGYMLFGHDNGLIHRQAWGSSESYMLDEIKSDRNVIPNAHKKFLINQLGGINVEHTVFMDFELYTIELLKGDKNYFASPYLFLAAHMKEQGFQMPPILSNEDMLYDLMNKGDVSAVKSFLEIRLESVKQNYDVHCVKHVELEIEEILDYTHHRNRFFDPSIALVEKFPDMNVLTVPGSNGNKKYNVLLIVESGEMPFDFGSIIDLPRKVITSLAKTGKYQGSSIFSTRNLPEAMEITSTGQIDAILMDAGYNRMAQLVGFAQQFNIGVAMQQDGDEIAPFMGDGYDEKLMWEQKIKKMVEANGYKMPPCTIIPSGILEKNVADLIDGMLNASDPFESARKKLYEKHNDEMINVYKLEERLSKLGGNESYQPLNEKFKFEDKLNWDKMQFEREVNQAESASKIGKAQSSSDFAFAFHRYIQQQIPEMKLDMLKPSEMMKGLHNIELTLEMYPEHAKHEHVLEELTFSLGSRLNLLAFNLSEKSFYTSIDGAMGNYLNVVSNAYFILNFLKNSEITKEEFSNILVREPGLYGFGEISLPDMVMDHMVHSMLDMARTFREADKGRFGTPLTNFFIVYAKKMTDLVDKKPEFFKKYKSYMR